MQMNTCLTKALKKFISYAKKKKLQLLVCIEEDKAYITDGIMMFCIPKDEFELKNFDVEYNLRLPSFYNNPEYLIEKCQKTTVSIDRYNVYKTDSNILCAFDSEYLNIASKMGININVLQALSLNQRTKEFIIRNNHDKYGFLLLPISNKTCDVKAILKRLILA